MSSFECFWKDSKSSFESVSSTKLAAGVSAGLSSIELISGFSSTQAEKEKFSEEVANYVTGDEFISSLSQDLGEPKTNETEEDFVERASSILRASLKKKFNV